MPCVWGQGHPGRDHVHQNRNVLSQDQDDQSEALLWLFSDATLYMDPNHGSAINKRPSRLSSIQSESSHSLSKEIVRFVHANLNASECGSISVFKKILQSTNPPKNQYSISRLEGTFAVQYHQKMVKSFYILTCCTFRHQPSYFRELIGFKNACGCLSIVCALK